MPATVRVVVYDSRINAMALPGGQVYRFIRKKANWAQIFSKMEAPKRTGRLASSIRVRMEPRAHGNVVGYVTAETYYATWVHEGTRSPIFPHGDFLWVPKFPHSTLRVHRESVRGQSANDFLFRGLARAMAMRDPFSR